MTNWYVKDLSKITNVSVQTLHHYDRINLLKPSLRLSNGYRVYSEKDLLKLQQIIALKFFGFELSQIQTLLTGEVKAFEHFSLQSQLIEQKTKVLLETGQIIKEVISKCSQNKSIPWETMIKLIEVYQMTKQLENSWAKEIFTPEELKQYVDFKSELKHNPNTQNQANFAKEWTNLVKEIENNLEKDPKSEIGINLAKKCMLLINSLYGKKYAHLRTKKFEQGFGEGKGLDEEGISIEIATWLEKSVDAYYKQRIYSILLEVGRISSTESLKLWREVLDEMYGDDLERHQKLVDIALQDDQVSIEAKKWLEQLSNI